MSERTNFEVFICVNEDGDYSTGTTEEEAWDALVDNVICRAVRCVAIQVSMTPPKIETASVDIPDDAGVAKAPVKVEVVEISE